MKVALIRCREETGARETNVTGIYPPLGLACLAAALRARAHDVCILDAEALGLGSKGALDAIPADAGVIGFTAMPDPRKPAGDLACSSSTTPA